MDDYPKGVNTHRWNNTIKIGIAGCGPAGLALALLLDRHGHEVCLYERFAEPRPLGSGIILQPTGLRVLDKLGLHQAIQQRGRRIDRMLGKSMPSEKIVLNVDYSALGDGIYGLAVHRAALFEVLFAAVSERSIPIRTECEVGSLRQGVQPAFVDSNGLPCEPQDLLVDATGSNSALQVYAIKAPRRRALHYGAVWGSFAWPGSPFTSNQLEQRYVNASKMIGVLPIGRHDSADLDRVAFFWSLRMDAFEQWERNGADAWKEEVLSIWPETATILDQVADLSDMSRADYGHSTLPIPAGRQIAFVGDAAHSTSPQLGQGANMALLDAWALARALSTHNNVDDALASYAESRRWHVRFFQTASYLLTPFYQSDSRALAGMRDALFDPVSRLPLVKRVVAGLITGLLGRPLDKLDLHEPST